MKIFLQIVLVFLTATQVHGIFEGFFCSIFGCPDTTVQEYISVLNAAQENTACTSAALGNAVATYDPASSMLCIKLSYSGLSGAETVSHIHGPAAIGADSGVQVNIGTLISSATQKTGCVTITAEQAVDLYNNMYYFNVHSDLCPAGEIRGQILRV